MNATEKYRTLPAPSALAASAPAKAPPPVLAMVLSDKIAAIGSATLCRISLSRRPDGLPACSSIATLLAGTEYRTASKTEHVAEVANTNPTTRESSIIAVIASG